MLVLMLMWMVMFLIVLDGTYVGFEIAVDMFCMLLLILVLLLRLVLMLMVMFIMLVQKCIYISLAISSAAIVDRAWRYLKERINLNQNCAVGSPLMRTKVRSAQYEYQASPSLRGVPSRWAPEASASHKGKKRMYLCMQTGQV